MHQNPGTWPNGRKNLKGHLSVKGGDEAREEGIETLFQRVTQLPFCGRGSLWKKSDQKGCKGNREAVQFRKACSVQGDSFASA